MFICPVFYKVKEGDIVYLRFSFRADHNFVYLTDVCLSHRTDDRLAVCRHKKAIVWKVSVYFQV